MHYVLWAIVHDLLPRWPRSMLVLPEVSQKLDLTLRKLRPSLAVLRIPALPRPRYLGSSRFLPRLGSEAILSRNIMSAFSLPITCTCRDSCKINTLLNTIYPRIVSHHFLVFVLVITDLVALDPLGPGVLRYLLLNVPGVHTVSRLRLWQLSLTFGIIPVCATGNCSKYSCGNTR